MVYEWSRLLRNFIYLNVSNRGSLVGTRGIHLSLNSLQPFIYQLLISLLFYNKVNVKLFPAFFFSPRSSTLFGKLHRQIPTG